jgi:hypothetical protein
MMAETTKRWQKLRSAIPGSSYIKGMISASTFHASKKMSNKDGDDESAERKVVKK